MISTPATCPYCNSLVTVTPGMVGGQRFPCPRCGESFTLLADEPASTDVPLQPSAAPPFETATDFQRNHWPIGKPFQAKRRTALILLGVMVCMAAGALAYALSTESFRRHNDKGIVKTNPKRRPPIDDIAPDNTPTPPAKLDALRWLPKDTTIVLGVHVRELLANEDGKALLTASVNVVGVSLSPGMLVRSTGFQIDEIDHLVLGIKAVGPSPEPTTLVVRTRQDFNEDELVKRLKAERAGTVGERRVYTFRIGDLFKPAVCFPDSHTAVYTLLPDHLKDIPASPRADLSQLPREVRDVLKERIGPVGPLWLAGHADDWSDTRLPMVLPVRFPDMKPADRARLWKVHTFAVWVQPDKPLLVQAAFDCGDDPTAKELQKYLDIPDAGADPDWKASCGGGWLTVQIRTTLDKVRSALER